MSWEDGKIKYWDDAKQLTFAPISYIVQDLYNAADERYRILNGGDLSGAFIFALGESSYYEMFQPYINSAPIKGISGDTVKLENINTLILLDNLIVGEFAGDTTWRYQVDDFPDIDPETDFVNYKDNNGNWHKKTDVIPPVWTRNTLLEELGQQEFIRLSSIIGIGSPANVNYYFHPITAKWARQCYRLLNLMRWTRSKWTDIANPTPDSFYIKRSTEVDYPTAVANWPDEWSYQVDTVIGGDSATTEIDDGITRLSRVYISDFQNHSFETATDKYSYDADLYCYIVKAGDVFHPDGNDWVKDKINLVHAYKGLKTTSKHFDFRDFLSVGPTPRPAGVNSCGWFIDQRQIDPTRVSTAVIKWDVDGGIQWVD